MCVELIFSSLNFKFSYNVFCDQLNDRNQNTKSNQPNKPDNLNKCNSVITTLEYVCHVMLGYNYIDLNFEMIFSFLQKNIVD